MQQVYAKSVSQLSKNGQNFVTMGALPIKKRGVIPNRNGALCRR
jgi:hypothetical protein